MDVARRLQIPKKVAQELLAKGPALKDGEIKSALLDAGRPASKADVARAREILLEASTMLGGEIESTSKDLRRHSSSQDASISFNGGNAAASPAYSRKAPTKEQQRDAQQLAEGQFVRFVMRHEIDARALTGDVLKAALAHANEGVRNASGTPVFSVDVGQMAAAMMAQRGVSGAKQKTLPEPKVLDALVSAPVKTAQVLGRVLELARAIMLDPAAINFTTSEGHRVRPDEHVFHAHRSFIDGVLQLTERLVGGEKISDERLGAAVQELAAQASKEYKQLLENPYDFALHEQLRGVKVKSEPKRTGFAHALSMLYVMQSETRQSAGALLNDRKTATAFVAGFQAMIGKAEYSRAQYDAMWDAIRR